MNEESLSPKPPPADGQPLSMSKPDFILINGETSDGKKFRPSDWCERLHSTLRALDPEEYEECAEYVHLVNGKNGRGILINHLLSDINPMLFNFFMNFVKHNHLRADNFSKESWHNLKNAD